MSFGELLLIGVIAIIVVGPRNLPSLLRNAGHIIGRVRRMAMDLRAESGIDDILEAEGIRSEIDNFRRLAAGQISLDDLSPNVVPEREREYPRTGCDAYGALSEDLVPYLPAPADLASESTPVTPESPSLVAAVSDSSSVASAPHAISGGPTPSGATPASPAANGAGIKN
jgi:sec-independent protein translocase protein TatB